MAFDYSRLRNDQLLRLYEVGNDFNKLSDDELIDLAESQEELGSFGAAVDRTLSTMKMAGLGALAELSDRPKLAQRAEEDYRKTMEEIALRAPEREVPSIAKVYDEEGLLGAIGDFPTFAYESLIETLPPLLGVGAAAVGGTLVGGPATGIAAGVATSSALESAFNVAAQMEDQQVGLQDVDFGKAALFGTAQGALEFLPIAKFGKIIKAFGKTEADSMLVTELKRNPLLQRGKQALQYGAGGAALEGLTEAAQESLSMIQAAPTVEEGMEILASLSPEVKNQLIDAGFAGAGVGGTIGTATGALRPTGAITEADIQRDLEASLAEENLSALQMQAFTEGAKPTPKKKAGEQTLEEAVDEVTAAQEAVAQEESRTLDDIEREADAPPAEGFLSEEMVVQVDLGNGVIVPLKKAEADKFVEQGLLDENYDYIEEVDNEKTIEYVDSLINDVQQQIEVEQPEKKMEESVASPQAPKYMILRKGPDGKDVTQSVTEEELTEQEKLEMIDAGVVVAEDFKNPPVIEEPVVEEAVVEEAVVEEEVAPEDDLPKAFRPENIMGTLKRYAEGGFENGMYYANDVLMEAVKQDPSLRPLVELRVGINDTQGVWGLVQEIDKLESKPKETLFPYEKKDLQGARSQLTKILRRNAQSTPTTEQDFRNALAKLLQLTKQGAEPVVQEEATPDIVIEEAAPVESAIEQTVEETAAPIEPEVATDGLASLRGKKKTKYGSLKEDLSDERFMVFSRKGADGLVTTLVDPQTGLVISHERLSDALYPYFRSVEEGGKFRSKAGTRPELLAETNVKEAIEATKEDVLNRSESLFVLSKESRTGSKGRIVPEGMLQRAREAWKTTSTKEYDAKIKDVMKSLEQRLKKLGLTDVQLKSRNIIGKIQDGVVEGESMINQKAAKSVITLATRLYDPSLDQQTLEAKLGSVMNHEIIHSLVDLGLLSPEEIQILSRNAAKIRYVDDKGNKRLFSFLDRAKSLYPESSEQLQQEEAVAEMFRAWAEGKLKVPGAQQTYFQRILNFFKELFGAHKDNGFTDVEDIFQAIEEGSIGARERVIREEDGTVSKEARSGPRKIGDRIVGSPPNQTTDKDRQNLVRRMFRYMESPLAVAEKSKDWYERSGETIRSITRGDPEMMERVARLMALYSQGNSVGGNTTAVIKSIYQLASGQDTAFAGRFPETTAKRIPDLLAAPVFDQSVEGVSDKIENFYRNLIDPAKGVDTYADASTMDKWMMRLMGYKVADDEDVGGASALSPTQYAYARDIMDRLVDAWFRKTGERLKPRQVQAVLWTFIKNRAEQDKIKDPDKKKAFQPKVVDFNDYMVRATAHITWEARPSESLPILDWIHTAPREVQEQWNEVVREILTNPDGSDKVMSLFPSEQLYNSSISTGAYEGKIAPNVISRIVLRKDDKQYVTDIANQYAAIMGYILKQDAVPWYRPDVSGGKLDSKGYDVSFNVDLTQELEQELFEHLDGLIPNIGYTKVDGNLQFINFRDENGKPMSGVADKKFEAQLVEALQSFPQEIDFSVTPFRAQSNYIFNDWTENQNGESYIESFGRREFADIQETVDGWATEISNAADIFDARRDELLNLDRTGAEQADVRARGGKRYSGKQSRKGYPQYESGRLGPAKGRSAFDVYHYSAQDGIDFLDSSKHGSGKAGLELKRGWKPRVFFYVQQEAERPRPEMVLRRMKNGYGAYLTNIYDPIKSRYILDEVKAKNNGVLNVDMMEDMIEAEGYDGYIAWSFQPTPAIVLLGENNVPVIQEMRNGEKLDSESALAQPKQSRRGDFTPSAEYVAIMNRVVARQNQDRPLGKLWDKIIGRVGNETYNQAFIRNVVNKYFPAFMLDQAAYGTMITDIDSVGRAMENAEQITGRLDALWNIGAFRYDRNTSEIEFVDEADNRGLYAIFDRIGEQNKERFHVYAIARRERDLRVNGRQGMTNMTDDEINNIIAEAPNFFEEVFEDYQQFNKRMVQFAVDAGIIEPSKAVDLVNMAYVPFYREMEADANDPMSEAEIIGPRASAALKNPRAFNIKIKGGDAPVGDFYENIVRNQEAILSASLRNIALQKTASALELLNAQGVTSWGRRATSVDKENVITVRYDGKSKRYKIDDASLWVSIANMNPKQQHALIQIGAMFGGILRSGITLFPGFMLANLIRGKVDGFVKTGVTLNPLSTIRGGLDEFREGELTAEIKSKTGIGGYTYGMGTKNFANSVKSKYRRGEMFKNPSLRSIGDALRGVKEGLERVGEATEFAERVALYDQLLKKGVSKREAAYKAMNLINFGRRGAGQGFVGGTFAALIPVVPFLNARIQGLYRLFENEQAQGKPSIIPPMEMLIRGSIITAASAGLYLWNSDDDRWDEEPIYRKVNYDIFYLDNGQTIYIPRAFEVGSIFGAIPVLALDALKRGDSKDLWQGTKEIFWNTLSFNPMPAAIRPTFEVYTNMDFFTGRSVESLGLQGLEKQDRFYETTPYFYRELSNLSRNNPFLPDFSPLQAQQIIEGHLGSLASAFVATADVLFAGSYPQKPTGTFGDPYSPTAMAASLTGVSRFLKDDSERTTRFVSEFYDLKRDIDAVHYSLKRASLAGDSDRINELLEEKGTAYGYRSQVNRVGRQLQKINAQIRAIMVNPDLTSSQKAEYIQPLREARNNLTRQVVQAAMQADLY